MYPKMYSTPVEPIEPASTPPVLSPRSCGVGTFIHIVPSEVANLSTA